MATLLATVPVLASVWLLLGSVGSVRSTVRIMKSKYIDMATPLAIVPALASVLLLLDIDSCSLFEIKMTSM